MRCSAAGGTSFDSHTAVGAGCMVTAHFMDRPNDDDRAAALPHQAAALPASVIPSACRSGAGCRQGRAAQSHAPPDGASLACTSNSKAMASTSRTRRWTNVSGRALPLCSDKNNRTPPRATSTNAGSPGSKRCSHCLAKPSRSCHAPAAAASSTRSRGAPRVPRQVLSLVEQVLLLSKLSAGAAWGLGLGAGWLKVRAVARSARTSAAGIA